MTKSHAITFGRLHTWTLTFFYKKAEDILTIHAPWRDAGVWVELPDDPGAKVLGGGVQVLVDPATGEAVAFKIANFRDFLTRHPELQVPWEQVKPSPIALRRMENTPFISLFLELMERHAYDHATQIDPSTL